MIDRYLYICSGSVFPCSERELKFTLDCNKQKILEKWPGHAHGKEYRPGAENGVLIIDLLNPGDPMTKEKLRKEGLLK